MSKAPLLLSSDGLYRLSHQQQEKELKANWKSSSSLCLVARECYWERIVSYPTSNIVELYKIIASEIDEISPLAGKTQAFIIDLSKNQASILYCCFSPEIIAKAGQYNLWRLIPESLPFYRSLPSQSNIFHSDIGITSLSLDGDQQIENESRHQTLFRTEAGKLSSLPFDGEARIPFSDAMLNEASSLDDTLYTQTLNKFRALDSLDFALQAGNKAKAALVNSKQLSSSIALFVVCLAITFVLGKSAFLMWQEEHLTAEITSSKADASESIRILNDYKQSVSDIEDINSQLRAHSPKSHIFHLLGTLPNESNELKFKTINISPSDIQVQGTIKSSATLLADLSKIEGFSNVSFTYPPAAIKNVGERFNISISYDPRIYSHEVIQ